MAKRPKIDSEKGMVEVGSREMKEKVQGPSFHIQEYGFAEVQEGGSIDKYKSSSDLYARYGQDTNFCSEKDLKVYSKVREIPEGYFTGHCKGPCEKHIEFGSGNP